MSEAVYKIIRKDILEVKDRNPFLTEDNAFIAWFIRTFISQNEQQAIDSITGKIHDKGIDALYIDHDIEKIYILQGKFHYKLNKVNEGRSDIIALADTGRILMTEEKRGLETIKIKANVDVQKKIEKAHNLIHKKRYALQLYYITTGKVSETHLNEAEEKIEDWENANYEAFTGKDLIRQMQDHLLGLSPPVPEIRLEISSDFFNRNDTDSRIESWVFSMKGSEIANVYKNPEIGERLFARNIRGYQGDTMVNTAIEITAKKNPQNFWYLNNGITIICDGAKYVSDGAKKFMRVKNAQVINGQQTTRTLSLSKRANKVSVLSKLLVIPRDTQEQAKKFEDLVNSIVAATNWQNAISVADLRSNDRIQTKIHREMKKLNYLYMNKSMKKAEARRIHGNNFKQIIDKLEMAQYAAAC